MTEPYSFDFTPTVDLTKKVNLRKRNPENQSRPRAGVQLNDGWFRTSAPLVETEPVPPFSLT